MSQNHKVNRGDCLVSIAAQYGFVDYHILWDHPQNASLKAKRKNPNTLVPGDVVFVPDKSLKDESRGTGALHVFQVPPGTALIRIRLQRYKSGPIGGTAYTLTVDGKVLTGSTTADGLLEQTIPAKAAVGELRLDDMGITWKLELGALQPIDTVAGLQARLDNLAYDSGKVDNIKGPITTKALREFQTDNPPLVVDGISGPHTQAAMLEKYGC